MPHSSHAIDRRRIDQLLAATSRTFALCIPMLPGPLRDSLGLGYLLLRNADTIEDAYRWPKQRRIELLEQYAALLQQAHPGPARQFVQSLQAEQAIQDKNHLALLKASPFLLEQLQLLPEPYVQAITFHIGRVIQRMQGWVANHDERNRLQLLRLNQLDDYCYAVAGIVGELVTSLISLYRPTLSRTRLLLLRSLETACGAGLQLTNILKDVFRDHLEGRYYIPQEYLPFEDGRTPEGLKPIFAHAYRNLCLGMEYACVLPEDEVKLRKSILVPMLLAVATLRVLLEQIEALLAGAEVKISRAKVAEILLLADRIAGENRAVERAWQDLSGPLLTLNSQAMLQGVPAG
jgi:farnesyl-diphosphate farnesyltransferase